MPGPSEPSAFEHAIAVAPAGAPSPRAFADALPGGIFVTDAAGRILYANPRLQRLFGLDAEALAAGGFLPAVDVEDRDRVDRLWSRAIADGAPWSGEFRCRR